MVVAGSNTAHYRFPCVTANTASVLTQEKQQSIWDKPQIQCKHCAARAPSTDVISVVQPSRTTESGHAQGKRSAREHRLQRLPINMQNTKKPQNQNRPDLPMDIPPHAHTPSSSRSEKAESAIGCKLTKQQHGMQCTSAEGWLMGLGCLAPQIALA